MRERGALKVVRLLPVEAEKSGWRASCRAGLAAAIESSIAYEYGVFTIRKTELFFRHIDNQPVQRR